MTHTSNGSNNHHEPKNLDHEHHNGHFRVAIFGSARIKPDDESYKQVFEFAKEIGKHRFDVVTGGGPGIMEAASAGHQAGDGRNEADSIGLTIQLPWEAGSNKRLEIKKHFQHFSDRLDEFMVLSNAVVVFAGGIGTALELFYTWQLTQVKHICPIPIILVGDMWRELVDWVKKWQVDSGLVSPEDLDNIFVVKNNNEAIKIIEKTYEFFIKEGENRCINYEKYKLDA